MKTHICISILTVNTGREILIEESDYNLISEYLWCESKEGYARTTSKSNKNKSILMHRLIFGNRSPELIDHINGNKLDNRRCNLRGCSNSQNQMNRQVSKNKSSQYKGVHWASDRGKWRALIQKDKATYRLGDFETEDAAAIAYNEKALQLFGTFARLNPVGEVENAKS